MFRFDRVARHAGAPAARARPHAGRRGAARGRWPGRGAREALRRNDSPRTPAVRSTTVSLARGAARSRRRALRRHSLARRLPMRRAFARIPRPDYPNATLDRLYALGIDAFRVAQAFADGTPDRSSSTARRATCRSTSTRQFVREGRLMLFRGGQIVPASRADARPPRAPRRSGAPRRSPPSFSRAAASRSSSATSAAACGEIDLVARDGDTLVFVEVRLRTPQRLSAARPRASRRRSARGWSRLRTCISRGLGRAPPCRFDAVLLDALDPARIEWLRDVVSA